MSEQEDETEYFKCGRCKGVFVYPDVMAHHNDEEGYVCKPCIGVTQDKDKPYYAGDQEIRIIFDGPPGPEGGRFVEVENQDGFGINVGEWIERKDGYWELRIPKEGEVEMETLTAKKQPPGDA